MENKKQNLKQVFCWLVICCSMIAIMILIGGLTRITDSGLSMVEWNIISGIIPPFNIHDWIELFNKYKQFPEYKLLNQNISLDDFQFIFWMEYIHRIWGRLIFLVLLIPFIYFLKKKVIPIKLKKHFFTIIVLIVLQGFFGWYMVKSGLIDNPNVSHYRLAIHLTTAFIIYGYLLFLTLTVYDLTYKKRSVVMINRNVFIINALLILLILFTVLSGGMVAGLNAGLVYNTFPLMGDAFVPKEIFDLNPKYLNFFENPITVQFNHRFLGILTSILSLILWFHSKKTNLPKNIKRKIDLIVLIVFFQIAMGVSTLLSYVAIHVALAHQFGALVLYSVSIWTLKSLPFVSK